MEVLFQYFLEIKRALIILKAISGAFIVNMQNSLSNIPGVGEKSIEALKRLYINNANDLLFHFPSNVIHKRLYHPIYSLKEGDLVALQVKIIDIDQPNNINSSRRKPFKIYCENDSGRIQLLYFSYYPQYLMNWAKIGSEIIVIGKIDIFNGIKHISHPEVINANKPQLSINEDEVVYPLTYGLINKQLQKYINYCLEKISGLEEWIEPNIIKQFGWEGFNASLKKIHKPNTLSDITPNSKERERIAYDELLATQLMVNILRQYKLNQSGRSIAASGALLKAFLSNLPFELTNSQALAIDQLSKDQLSGNKMSRLLQGDVGSGKTVVAIAAMLNSVESKTQSVLMAPTDVLANQHFLTLEKFLKTLPVKFALLTGKTKPKERAKIMEGLINGEIQILVGTHAVFQDKVSFNDLALVVIDEQHRFGVEQRLSLVNKGNEADLLIMSATPIPRSLSLVLYGDMDVTRINEKPKSRIPIQTSVIAKSKLKSIIDSLENILKSGGKVYWICPLVSQSEEPNLEDKKMAAETRMQSLAKIYPGIVGLVHGQLDNRLKQENLSKFANGDYRILVATTVVEVGVDVPDATVIIIENAESFGLSQLHQLRGRVGRGDKPSYCILLYSPPIGNSSWQRLNIVKNIEDGFILAEEDLKLRGGGDLSGTKQSGLPDFRAVDFVAHHHLISLANAQAKNILGEDPTLSLPYNNKYHDLLKVFGFSYKSLDW